MLFNALGVTRIMGIHAEPTGLFAHNPEPLPENLQDIRHLVKETGADVGFVVDPDVDRLAMVMENGEFFGEEYTLVAVSDYILRNHPGDTVSNLSSTRALRDVTEKYGGTHHASAVGEVNVVEKMKQVHAVIGGEGNGGIIYPELHYGRDALVGIALFLTWLAKSGLECSQLRRQYPDYFISKNKIQLGPGINPEKILVEIADKYSGFRLNKEDGLRIDFPGEWVHLRRSNTEPIIRIYAESCDPGKADALAKKIMDDISRLVC
jgi:phosphomannomutase